MNDHRQERRRIGQVKEVTSLTNPIVKDIRALSQKKHREETGQFMAEGLKLVIDALELGWTVRTLIYAKAAKGKPKVEAAALKALNAGALVLEVSEKVLTTITRRDNPQSVVGIFEQRYLPLARLQPSKDETWIALDRVRDPGNLGTIIRTADAAGASGVVLLGDCVDPFSLETVRATMGSVFAVPLVRTGLSEFIDWARRGDVQLVGTHLEGAVDYRSIDYRRRATIIVMGNEQQGLPGELASACAALARIPQQGRADSLNLAVATAVMLFEARRHLLTLESKR
ncbi:TrmH family RNA methyltransferase [Pararhizobium haloflavum]|uniref:TrmH family RNA methyltransferase n=1 Tax=Pararhizobium haloflavum TaxID=2037914 RepID=UPI000C190389|nr:RNA methyltransferase [Pararhizobium haloflavum]